MSDLVMELGSEHGRVALLAPTITEAGVTAEGYYATQDVPAGSTVRTPDGRPTRAPAVLTAGLWVVGAPRAAYALEKPIFMEFDRA